MLSPRRRKVLRDLWENRGHAVLVIFAMALGVFGFTWVSSSSGVLTRELRSEYLSINPASFTLLVDPFDSSLIPQIASVSGVGGVEAARSIDARFQTDTGVWRPLKLFVVPDYTSNQINQIASEKGAFPSSTGEILIERSAMQVARAQIGDSIHIQIPGEIETDLRIAGTVHDLNQSPAWQEGMVYGYLSTETLAQFGLSPEMTELQVVVADDYFNVAHVQKVASDVKAAVEASGLRVYQIRIPQPGAHAHQGQMESLLMLQQSFGLLALLLSGALTANMISALLAQQVRQIGVLKAIGGTSGQIARMYFSFVLILAVVALIIAMPIGLSAGRGYTAFVALLLNFNVRNDQIPHPVIALQIGVGLLVPLLAAAYPILRGSRLTVYEAIRDYGVGQEAFKPGRLDQLLSRWPGSMRPLLLSVRNTFRRRGRLVLTFATLALGGATFMAALNLNSGLIQTLEQRFTPMHYDIDVRLDQPTPIDDVKTVVLGTEGVTQMEALITTTGSVAYSDGTYSNVLRVLAPIGTASLVDFPLIEGRILQPDDDHALLINHILQAKIPGLVVGDTIMLRINGQETSWQIVGVYQEIAGEPAVTMPYNALSQILGQTNTVNTLRIVTQVHDGEGLLATKHALEQSFTQAGLAITANNSIFDNRKVLEEHSVVLVTFLMVMTFLSVIVGGLGLMSTMSINVLERTREIGVLRAIGASNGIVMQIILIEGALIGVLSWALACLITLPVSYIFGVIFGTTLLETPLNFVLNPTGLLVWLLVVIVFSAAASIMPAWNAISLTVRDVLAYE